MPRIPSFLFALTLFAWSSSASAAKKPDCDWSGEAKDPFTGVDSRTTGRSWMNGVTLRFTRLQNDASTLNLAIAVNGLISEPWTGPVMFLTGDGSVVTVAPKTPALGTPFATGGGVRTEFKVVFEVPKAEMEKLATAESVTNIRFTVPC